jgi:DNA-binding LytR/AlgR family response regulator
MYQVAICEDEQVFSDAHENICRTVLTKLSVEYQISVFASGEDFFATFDDQHKRYDLILLDIEMKGIYGIELAKLIRRADENVDIVFITSHAKYALQGYDVSAFHYLIKPVDTLKLESLIAMAYTKKHVDDVFVVKSGDQHIRIPIKDIVYLETDGRQVAVYLIERRKDSLSDRKVYYSGKLSELLNELPKGLFVRCHQAYAIHIKNARELTRKSVLTVDKKEVPVSRTYLDETRTAFMRQMGSR